MAKKKNSASQVAVWIILLLLIVGLAGFGATNFGGTVNTVASVGDREITVNRYARSLNQEINRLSQQFGTQLTFSQAQLFGVDRAVLSRMLATAALENEADALGISAGDDRVRDAVLEVTAFQGVDGSFDREGYRFSLEQAGMSEAEFEETLRLDLARSVLTDAVAGAAAMPDVFIDTLITYQAETRDLTWAMLGPDDLVDPIPDPAEEELRAYWEGNPDSYMLPETRDITYAWLTPEMIAGTIEGDDAVLQDLYADRASDYNRPERRLVERLIFTSQSDADAALTAVTAGETSFEELVAARDLTLDDVDLGDVTLQELGAAGDVVFALEGPGLAGPVETDLGFALFRMNGILAAQVTSFEDAREELLVEYRTDAARRAIEDMIEEIDDLLAGGATLEDLASETELKIGQIDWTDGASEGIAAFAEFREAAADVEVGDFPEGIFTEDGALFALRVDEIVEPRVEPFDDARTQVEEDWRLQKTVEALAAQARTLAEELKNAETDAPIPSEDMPDPEPGAEETTETAPDAVSADSPQTDEAAAPDPDASDVPGTDIAETPAADDTVPPDTVAEDTPAAIADETPDIAADETPGTDNAAADEVPAETGTGDVPAPEADDTMIDTAADDPPVEEAPAPVAYVTEVGIARGGFIADTPSGFVDTVFDMELGEIRVIEGTTAAYLVRVDAITPPDLADPEMVAQADAIREQLAATIGDDILTAYAAAIQAEAGISLNQAAINAVHTQLTQ